MPNTIEKIEQFNLPMIPLRGLVAFPEISINFELERSFSIAALKEAEKTGMMLFVVSQKDISVDKPTPKQLYRTGAIIHVRQSLKTPEGLYRVVADVVSRATASSFVLKNEIYYASVLAKKISLDNSANDFRVEALREEVLKKTENLIQFIPNVSRNFLAAAKSAKDPGFLADLVASSLFVRPEDKQTILDEYHPIKRLEKLLLCIENEQSLLLLENDIQAKVKEQMDRNQRDYYLKEQMKVIQEELGQDGDDEVSEFQQKLNAANLPKEVHEKLQKEINHLSRTAFGSPEATVLHSYLETCLDIPWAKKTVDRLDIEEARKILDKDHDGLTKVKERIVEYLAVKQLNPEIKNQLICLVGPPGTGKTSLGQSIARAMKRKFVRVSLGGIRDEAEIRGHRKTYIAAMPGRIVNALIEAKSMNPIIMLDEIDKLCADIHGDPASALLEVMDPEQNKSFRDHFVELPIDLSDCIFIATANTMDTIPRPLLDRVEVIELHTYTENEKTAIALNHLLPKQLKRHGLNKKTVKIPEATIRELIKSYTRESGVRNLERQLASLSRKAACLIIDQKVKTLTIKPNELEKYLGPKPILPELLSADDEVGVVNGLAYTEAGGDLLKVETIVMEGTGKVETTGSLGDVMKESAHIAVSFIRANADKLGVDKDFYKTKDLHIHFPEGAVPKDGPSAGVTMVTSIVSALTGKPVRRTIAMTGEVTLTGKVLPIGGLREKTMAAWSAGVTEVCIPAENMRDLEEIDQEVRKQLLFVPCKTLSDVLNEALVSTPVIKEEAENECIKTSPMEFSSTSASRADVTL